MLVQLNDRLLSDLSSRLPFFLPKTDIVDKELKDDRNTRWERAFSCDTKGESVGDDHMNLKAAIVIEHLVRPYLKIIL